MTDSAAWEQVAETSQVYEAELIALRLREAGIEARVLDQSFRQEPLPNVRSFAVVRVLVPADLAEEARRVLEEAKPIPWEAEPAEPVEEPEATCTPSAGPLPLRGEGGGEGGR